MASAVVQMFFNIFDDDKGFAMAKMIDKSEMAISENSKDASDIACVMASIKL